MASRFRTLLVPIFVAILTVVPAALVAQRPVSQPGVTRPRATASRAKSPTAARLIGIIPGAGHVYAGEPKRGLMFFGGTVGVAALGTLLLATDCLDDAGSGDDCTDTSTDVIVAAATLGVWGWSIYDAGNAARRTNASRSIRVGSLVSACTNGNSARASCPPRLHVIAMVR